MQQHSQLYLPSYNKYLANLQVGQTINHYLQIPAKQLNKKLPIIVSSVINLTYTFIAHRYYKEDYFFNSESLCNSEQLKTNEKQRSLIGFCLTFYSSKSELFYYHSYYAFSIHLLQISDQTPGRYGCVYIPPFYLQARDEITSRCRRGEQPKREKIEG